MAGIPFRIPCRPGCEEHDRSIADEATEPTRSLRRRGNMILSEALKLYEDLRAKPNVQGTEFWKNKIEKDPTPGLLYEGKAALDFASRERRTVYLTPEGSGWGLSVWTQVGQWGGHNREVAAMHILANVDNLVTPTPLKHAIENALPVLKWIDVLKMAHEGTMGPARSDVEMFIIECLNDLDRLHRVRYVEMTFNRGTSRFARHIDGDLWEWSDEPSV
jgi:hypothetical protein